MQTSIDLQFADGAYTFALGLAQVRELQAKTGAGVGAIYARVMQGRFDEGPDGGHPLHAAYMVDDLRETVRQGLIGGGRGRVDGADVLVTSLRATELIENYLDPMPLTEQWSLAAAILGAKVQGYVDAESESDLGDEGDADKKKAGGSTTPAP